VRRQTTKELLAESFLELAQKTSIDKITITEITNNCQMSQPTFYNHFQDKYDLIAWVYTKNVNRIMENIGQEDYKWENTLMDGAKYFEDNKVFILNALKHTSGQDSFMRNMTAINEKLLITEIRKKLKQKKMPILLEYYIKFYCHGTVQFLFDWLIGEINLTCEEIAEIWKNSLPEVLKIYLLS